MFNKHIWHNKTSNKLAYYPFYLYMVIKHWQTCKDFYKCTTKPHVIYNTVDIKYLEFYPMENWFEISVFNY